MSYESRLFVVNCRDDLPFGQIICAMDLCKMDDPKFFGLFTTPINYDLYLSDDGEAVDCDDYDDFLNDAPIQAVIEWLEEEVKVNDYRRLKPFLFMLKGFDRSQWDDLRGVHYGY